MSPQQSFDLFTWLATVSIGGAFFYALNDYLNDREKK